MADLASEVRDAAPTPPERAVGPLTPFRSAPFLATWTTGAFSSSANWMMSLAVPVLVWSLTESVTLVGSAAAAANLPAFVGSPLGGVWADRYPKRFVLLAALSAQVGLAFALYRASQRPDLTVSWLLSLTAANGLASSINLSAYQALVAEIVPERAVRPAYRLNAIQFNASRAIGPAVAGWVLAGWGAPTAFLVNAFAHLPLILTLFLIRPRLVPRTETTHVVREILEAARVTARIPALRTSLITIVASSAFGMSIQQLAKGLTEQVFHVGDAELGMLVASIGLFAVATSVALAFLGERFRGSVLVRGGLVLYGAGLLVVAATGEFLVALVGFAITGLAHVLVNISVTMAIQSHVPDAYRGRVTSLQLMAIILSMAFGAQLGGALGDLVGLPLVVGGYGTALVVFAAVGHLRMDRLHALD
ncbi:MAG: MFS transporter [Myxococcota bacterium]